MKEVDDVLEKEACEGRLDKAVRDWLALGPKNKRPKNDTRKKN